MIHVDKNPMNLIFHIENRSGNHFVATWIMRLTDLLHQPLTRNKGHRKDIYYIITNPKNIWTFFQFFSPDRPNFKMVALNNRNPSN